MATVNKTQKISSKSTFLQEVVGYNRQVPLLNGTFQRYINFDNAASTPALKPVLDKVNEAMEWYSSIHRGTGFKSQLCSRIYDQAREVVADFVNIDPASHAIIFGKNATEAINKLARRMRLAKDQIVLVSKMEHHSNDLPWRANGQVKHIGILEDGQLDLEDLVHLLKKYYGKTALVALTGASNVTGWVNDIAKIAGLCHEYGTKLLVDAAQLAPHRRIDMKPDDDPEHIDFLVISAHKIYAPFGSGALIGDKDFFKDGDPDDVGGGTIKIVDLDYAHWSEPPEKDEAGTPNTIGVIAFAKALLTIMETGIERIVEHEKKLTGYILKNMAGIPGIEIYGSSDPAIVDNRLGVISFNIKDIPHALTAAILNYEGGIGVRNGCFCAQPYIKELLGINSAEGVEIKQQILRGDRSRLPGAVRVSFGFYNTPEEIDRFIELLKIIATGEYEGKYLLDKQRGEYHPEGYSPSYTKYFQL
ncbi:MAG: aminotransferase class V-fold PLP-dependent enzyme [Calditrichaeota bacterium]|nr:aminotransferase class V-fold PLP-dependent enzyme [Calditrichota bacterium]RQW01720.1 MAG: aminotransferase class V-fold PLP-dependent enzyme [Calditrichota bacterium]